MELIGWGVAIAGAAVGMTIGATMDPIGQILAKLPFQPTVAGFAILPLVLGAALIFFGWSKARTDGNVTRFLGGLALGYGLLLVFNSLGVANPLQGILGA